MRIAFERSMGNRVSHYDFIAYRESSVSLGNKSLFFIKYDVSALSARVVPIIRIKYGERCYGLYDQTELPSIVTILFGMRRAVPITPR